MRRGDRWASPGRPPRRPVPRDDDRGCTARGTVHRRPADLLGCRPPAGGDRRVGPPPGRTPPRPSPVTVRSAAVTAGSTGRPGTVRNEPTPAMLMLDSMVRARRSVSATAAPSCPWPPAGRQPGTERAKGTFGPAGVPLAAGICTVVYWPRIPPPRTVADVPRRPTALPADVTLPPRSPPRPSLAPRGASARPAAATGTRRGGTRHVDCPDVWTGKR